ncbi:T9SS type A sorting domain-containing protein [Sporocytophaga myxococcoides]|uniref:T9SS type A sorting domain-containing protein n=1 Tax=Sporocytophaga myxococcoides TaxID=153721 RepID=UPI0004904CB1|nr:T9SS type A sorting domain-containing protein [Sporocytophaga myxococcoides]
MNTYVNILKFILTFIFLICFKFNGTCNGKVLFPKGINAAPTNITISSTSVTELNFPGVFVGKLTATDTDPNDKHSFVLATGGTDNNSFMIRNDSLFGREVFTYRRKPTYSIIIEANDGTNTFKKTFTISVAAIPAKAGYSGYNDTTNLRLKVINYGTSNLIYMGVYYPEKYYTNPELKWPVIVQFGGLGEMAGETGTSAKIWSFGPMKDVYNKKEFNYIIVCPIAKNSWDPVTRSETFNWINENIYSDSRIDRNRIFTTGISNGAPDAPMRVEVDGKIPVAGIIALAPRVNSSVCPSWGELNKTALWAMTRYDDARGNATSNYTSAINQPGRDADTRVTIFSGSSHNIWNYIYNGGTQQGLQPDFPNNSLYPDPVSFPPLGNIYNYMDQIRRTDIAQPPTEPMNFEVSLAGIYVNLSWNDFATNEKTLRIRRKREGGEFTDIYSGAPITSYTDKKAIPGNKYYYQVRYENSPEVSSWTPLKSIFIPENNIPRTANNILLTGNTVFEENTIGVVGKLEDNAYPQAIYSVVDNSNFVIQNDSLLVLINPYDYEINKEIKVVVRANNSVGYYDETYTIRFTDVPETPYDDKIVQIHLVHTATGLTQTYTTKGNLFNLLRFANSTATKFTNSKPLICKDGKTTSPVNITVFKSATEGFTYSSGTADGKVAGNNSGVVPDIVLKNFLSSKITETGVIQLSGLSASKKYTIKTLSNGKYVVNCTSCIVDVSVQDNLKKQFYSPDISSFLVWNNVAPDASGIISVKVNAGDSLSVGVLNAITVQEEIYSIALSNSSIEGYAAGLLGTLSTTLPEASFSIAENPNLILIGNQLYVVNPYDYTVTKSDVIKVKASNGSENVEFSFTITITDPLVLGSTNQVSIQDLVVFPNPASSYVTIESEMLKVETPTFKVRNILGSNIDALFIRNSDGKYFFDVSTLDAGVYWIEALIQGKIYHKSLIVTK